MKFLFATFSLFCLFLAAAPHCYCEGMNPKNAAADHGCCTDKEQAPCENCPAMQSLDPVALVVDLTAPTPTGTNLLPELLVQTEVDPMPFVVTTDATAAIPRLEPPPLQDRLVLFSIFLI